MEVSLPEEIIATLSVRSSETLIPRKAFFPALLTTQSKDVDAEPSGLTDTFQPLKRFWTVLFPVLTSVLIRTTVGYTLFTNT